MGVGNYNENSNDEYISLWTHSSAFRKLVYATLSLIPLMVLGFYLSDVEHKQNLAHQQFEQQIQQMQNHPQPQKSKITAVSQTKDTSTQQAVAPPLDELSGYSMGVPWFADTVNPNTIVPDIGFDGYYFNGLHPQVLLHKSNNKSIFLDHSSYKIASKGLPLAGIQNLGAYWVGRLTVSQDDWYEISGNLQDSNVQILLNRRLINDNMYKTTNFPRTQIFLKQGSYVLEVEYQNLHYAPAFSMTVGKPIPMHLKGDGMRKAISALNLPVNTKLYLATVKASSSPEHDVTVLANVPDPYVLHVSSNEVVHWKIDGTPPRAVIFSEDSTVTSVGEPALLKTSSAGYALQFIERVPSCTSCENGILSCGNISFETRLEQYHQDMGLPLSGSTGRPTATMLTLPNITFDETMIQNYINVYAQNVAECSKTGRVIRKNFDDLH